MSTIVQINTRGTLTIPKELREKFGLSNFAILEETAGGLVMRPAAAYPVEIYTNERKAEFRLTSALNAQDYQVALKEVRAMGLDPATIPHTPIGKERR